jgi:hypothetical protein
MINAPFDRAALRAYMVHHQAKGPVMAAHAGIPYRTLCGTLGGREPSWKTRAAIEWALGQPPPIRRLPHHGQQVADAWPHRSASEIARGLGISHQRVFAIAKAMGLPPKRKTRNAAE